MAVVTLTGFILTITLAHSAYSLQNHSFAAEQVYINDDNITSNNTDSEINYWTRFQWISNNDVGREFHRFTPLLQSGSVSMFAFRAKYNRHYVSGKFYLKDARYYAFYGVDGNEREIRSNYEVLYTPPGSVMWQRYSGSIPTNAVSVGTDPNNFQVSFLCQAIHQNLLVLGRMPSNGNCYVPYADREHAKTSFDILVLTEAGKAVVYPTYLVGHGVDK